MDIDQTIIRNNFGNSEIVDIKTFLKHSPLHTKYM